MHMFKFVWPVMCSGGALSTELGGNDADRFAHVPLTTPFRYVSVPMRKVRRLLGEAVGCGS